MEIKPLNQEIGFGLMTINEPLDSKYNILYDYKPNGIYHNYFFKSDNIYAIPETPFEVVYPNRGMKLDGFSPNLNKELHIGHLRNLIVASSLSNLCQLNSIILFGTTLCSSEKQIKVNEKKCLEWCKLANYKIWDRLYDFNLIGSAALLYLTSISIDGKDKYEGSKVWKNNPTVVLQKSNGEYTYSFYDLMLSTYYCPNFYLVGAEQKEHFEILGLGNKHIKLGLVLDAQGKKMKSRTGDSFSADDAFNSLYELLKNSGETYQKIEEEEFKKVVWNVLAINFLISSPNTNLKWAPESWITAENAGLYICYTLARINSVVRLNKYNLGVESPADESIWRLSCFAAYHDYYKNEAISKMKPNFYLNYLLKLCFYFNTMYHKVTIKESMMVFSLVEQVQSLLINGIKSLGLNNIEKI